MKDVFYLVGIDGPNGKYDAQQVTSHQKALEADLVLQYSGGNSIFVIKSRYSPDGMYYHKDVVDNLRQKLAETIKENHKLIAEKEENKKPKRKFFSFKK